MFAIESGRIIETCLYNGRCDGGKREVEVVVSRRWRNPGVDEDPNVVKSIQSSSYKIVFPIIRGPAPIGDGGRGTKDGMNE